jgi:sugar/nucleoside kinase (ribokinase family)
MNVPEKNAFDILFLGAFTRDTIVGAAALPRITNGGAFYYGANVAARMGLSVAAVTRLAREDFGIVRELRSLGVFVAATVTPESTRLRIEYPSADPDERVIQVESTSGSFRAEDLGGVRAGVAVIGASLRGEVPEELLRTLVSSGCRIALDVQGFVRVLRDGILRHEEWPEARRVLPMVSILKADATEAEVLTGTKDLQDAASRILAMGAAEALLTNNLGVHAAGPSGTYDAPFMPRRLVGRSGRGDTCLAAYAARRISQPASEASLWAAAVTSLKLESDGPFHHSLAEIESRARHIGAGT